MKTVPAAEAAAVLLVDRTGALLLQLRDAYAPSHPNMWCVPGGLREAGETPVQAAARELWEEALLRADDGLRLFERRVLPDGRIRHYFSGATCAEPGDVVRGEGAAMVFVPPEQVFDGRPLTAGGAEILRAFLASPRYAALASGQPVPYRQDDRYAGWSYLTDRRACPRADAHRTCHRRADLLLAQGRTGALGEMAAGGHRCAYLRLMRAYVDGDRADELRTLALTGDDQAAVTFYEYLTRRHGGPGLREALRREAALVPRLASIMDGVLPADGRPG